MFETETDDLISGAKQGSASYESSTDDLPQSKAPSVPPLPEETFHPIEFQDEENLPRTQSSGTLKDTNLSKNIENPKEKPAEKLVPPHFIEEFESLSAKMQEWIEEGFTKLQAFEEAERLQKAQIEEQRVMMRKNILSSVSNDHKVDEEQFHFAFPEYKMVPTRVMGTRAPALLQGIKEGLKVVITNRRRLVASLLPIEEYSQDLPVISQRKFQDNRREFIKRANKGEEFIIKYCGANAAILGPLPKTLGPK